MARLCACLAPTTGQARAHLDAMGALGPGHVPADVPGAELSLLPGEHGRAEGPFTALGRTAVGEVTLHNRPVVGARQAHRRATNCSFSWWCRSCCDAGGAVVT